MKLIKHILLFGDRKTAPLSILTYTLIALIIYHIIKTQK